MGSRDPRVDAYIDNSADFAKPILTHLRGIVHAACPEVEETMKWSFPHFMYHGLLCSMAAFKQHCTFNFWKGSAVVESHGTNTEKAMGQFGRIKTVADLPSDQVLAGYINKAMELNAVGTKVPGRSKKAKQELIIPDYFATAMRDNERVKNRFEAFSPSQQREYVEWLAEAKGEATRKRRLDTAMEWIAEGKPRHWKYMKS